MCETVFQKPLLIWHCAINPVLLFNYVTLWTFGFCYVAKQAWNMSSDVVLSFRATAPTSCTPIPCSCTVPVPDITTTGHEGFPSPAPSHWTNSPVLTRPFSSSHCKFAFGSRSPEPCKLQFLRTKTNNKNTAWNTWDLHPSTYIHCNDSFQDRFLDLS